MAVCHKVDICTNIIICHSKKMFRSEYWPCVEGSVLHENENTSTKTRCTKHFEGTRQVGEKQREKINKTIHPYKVIMNLYMITFQSQLRIEISRSEQEKLGTREGRFLWSSFVV